VSLARDAQYSGSDVAEGSDMVESKAKLKELRCRRTGRMYTVAEHLTCPYCSGKAEDIAAGGDYECFCEFEEGKDPVTFGFPDGTSRNEHG
jgi:hypothetical protein